ncbi:GNAT family N-acetyltransferase [Brunnivagina elsteri]|uniref:GNAT family N-acetyltransferase n=1 Tax=Brunnivagina elsteri CCALA 953 TaxID=987040 RepID=A0A2A2TBD2_9CYAN|nr:GNAT family N-acetyltransferase [Calothrix elsteri]PAX51033.1 GNAT family N-acetyltransferase [Calothrix elsteri CCALA 953]
MQIPKIITKRLILRGFEEKDLDAYAEMGGDSEVMRYIGTGQILSRSESWRNMAMILGHWQLRGYGMWAVEERQSGEMIGRVGCWQPEGWIGLEIGWTIRRAFWRQGFATEAGKIAIAYAFNELQETHVISLIHPENIASRRVAKKLGEKLQASTEVMGKEALVFGISHEEWKIKSQAVFS